MKRTTISFLVISMLLLFATCKKDIVDRQVGVYLGTLSSQEIIKDSVEFHFEIDSSNEEILMLFEHPLKHETDNQYMADETIVLEIIRILFPKTTRTQIANTFALFVFEENEVTMDLTYSTAGNSESLNIRFIGKKK